MRGFHLKFGLPSSIEVFASALTLVHRLPGSVQWFNVDIVERTSVFRRSKACALQAGKPLLLQESCDVVNVINQEIEVVQSLSMLLQEVLIDGIPLNLLNELELYSSDLSYCYLLPG